MHLPFITLLPLLALTPLIAAHQPHAPLPNRRHHAKNLRSGPIERAGAPYDNATIEGISASLAAYSASLTAAASSASTASPSIAASSAAADDNGNAVSSVDSVLSSAAASSAAASAAVIVSTAAAQSSAVDDLTAGVTSATPSSVAAVSTIPMVSTAPTSISPVTTIDDTNAVSTSTSTFIRSANPSVVTATRIASSVATASSAADSTSSSKSGLSKTTLIAIIVVASVVGLAAVGWTAFRKWKLKPSGRFDSRMKPIDFSPKNGGMQDDFLEKTLVRSHSNSSLDRQRQQFVHELDQPASTHLVSGIPEHDFTAGSNNAGQGAYNMDMYNHDPFAHAESYDYDAVYNGYNSQGQGAYDAHPQHHQYPPAAVHADYPTQDQPIHHDGYADLQRGNSDGSNGGSRSGHGHSQAQAQNQVYPSDFPMPEQYLGRPTGGADGPYAQAAQYRGY